MKPAFIKSNCTIATVLAGMLAVSPLMADPPSWAGKGKGKSKEARSEQRDDHGRGHQDSAVRHFHDRHRVVVREYFDDEFRGGRCPPGLAKKRNGCMPPGQAKKWAVGRPLPRDVVYYAVPQPLLVRLGPPPSGHRYVRVASDILLIAIGTAIVVDAIQDLGRI